MKYFLLTIVLAFTVIGTDAVSPKLQTTKRASSLMKGVRNSAGQCVPRVLFTKTAAFGGPGGNPFDDASFLRFDEVLKAIYLQADGARIYRIEFETQYVTYHHGGIFGSRSSFYLRSSEKITSVDICDTVSRALVVAHLKFTTNVGRTFSAGPKTHACRTIYIPSDKEIVAGFGRAGAAPDKLGFVLRVPMCSA